MSLTVVLCFLTSTGAFLCLTFLRSGVLHDLGWFASLSVAGAAFFALVILPHLLGRKGLDQTGPRGNTFVDKIAAFPFEKKYGFAVILVILGLVSFYFMRHAGFVKDMKTLNYKTKELQTAEQDLDKINMGSLMNITLVSTGKTLEDGLISHERTEKYIRELMDKKMIAQTSGIGDLLPSDPVQHMRIRRWNQFWTAGKKDSLKKIFLAEQKKYGFRESAFNEFFAILDKEFKPLNDDETEKIRTSLLRDWINETPGLTMISDMIKVRPDDRGKIYEMFRNHPGVVAFDKQMITDRFVEDIRHDFNLLVRLSMIFVSLLLILSFGRIELGLISALPMFFSWLITLGFMGATGIEFNIFNIIISSFIFGLGVDYSILMMRGLLYQYKYGKNEMTTYKVAIFISSLTTLFGVTALFFARHPALHSVALIAIVGIVAVVLVSYTFQPLLANWMLLDRRERNTFPITARIFIKTIVTWTNIVMVALLMMITGTIIFTFFPISRKRKGYLFHLVFSWLCRGYIAFTFPVKRKIYNPYKEDFQKPAVIISNHQSLIETPAFLRLYPRILILTGEWIYGNLVFGPIARMASYFNAEAGIDTVLKQLKEKAEEGYSILVFPEAHRSDDHKIQRFHTGVPSICRKS